MTDLAEIERHRREVKQVLGIRAARGSVLAHDYLERVETARGQAVREKLEQDCLEQWALGNRGTTWLNPARVDA